MSFFNNTPNFDNLLLQSLMGRAPLRPPNPLHLPFLNQTIEDILLGSLGSLNLSDHDEQFDYPNKTTKLAKEEAQLEKEIIRTILSGEVDTLQANSGQAVSIGEHNVCVGYRDNSESDYRVWEWHGHIMLFDEENGYTPEYIYGNYLERLLVRPPVLVAKEDDYEENEDHKEEKVGNVGGLRELIDSGDSRTSRILHRNINAGSPRF